MFAYSEHLEPPPDNIEKVESIMAEAFEDFLKRGYNKSRFQDLYDLVFEAIEENLHKYELEPDYDFGY